MTILVAGVGIIVYAATAPAGTQYTVTFDAGTGGFSFTNNKGLMSVLCFVGILIVLNTLTNFLGVREVENLTEVTVDSFRGGVQVAQGSVGKAILYTVFQGALLYLATVLGLKKGLNLA